MFSGIVERLAPVVAHQPAGGASRLTVDLGRLAAEAAVGDSVAVNGVCLTITQLEGSQVHFDVIRETLERTNLGPLQAGDSVNLELALRVGDRIGGHLVTGHVDGVARIREKTAQAGQTLLTVAAQPEHCRYMIPKGSITLDGVSLTLVAVGEEWLQVALIPHTLAVTTLGGKGTGDLLNLECDQMGRWVEKLLHPYSSHSGR